MNIFYCLLLIPIIMFFLPKYWSNVSQLLQPHQDISQTSEYQIAAWLKEHTKGERVYATGSSAFWLNTFTDIPQIRGGNDGVTNPWILHAVYQINTAENAPTGKEGLLSLWWLRILNVSYLVVNLPDSREIYHDFKNPERFAQVEGMPQLANLSGDVIYKVPLKHPSLAQVVKRADFQSLVVPKNAVDEPKVEKYVNYLDGQSTKEAEFSWLGLGKAKIKAQVRQDEGIAVQVAYRPGWKAYLSTQQVTGKSVKVNKDVIDFIFLDPQTSGDVEIELVYKKTWDVWLGYIITLVAIGCLFQESRKPRLFKPWMKAV